MKASINELEEIARELRIRIIENAHQTSTPHLGSCLSIVDILVALYFSKLNINSQNPHDPDRDRFILSKGHGAPALFQVLAKKGFFSEALLTTYGDNGSILAEHPPAPDHLAGIEAATGSLGHGLPIALGMALAARIQKQDLQVYAVLGDGECNEGSIWEAAMLAAAQKLNNLCIFVDFNKWQATDRSESVLALNPLTDKWRAFGWETVEIDGHNLQQILNAVNQPKSTSKPLAIIAHTIKGKGVSFMEDDNNWHYRIPNTAELEAAKKELEISG